MKAIMAGYAEPDGDKQVTPFWRWFIVGFIFGIAGIFWWGESPAAEKSWKQEIHAASVEYQIPERFLHRIALRESSFRSDIAYCDLRGLQGEEGLMQLHPRYHDVEACVPSEAIPYAAAYIKHLYAQTDSWWLTAAAYNWGIGNITTKSYIPRSVVDYANFVMEVE